VLTIDDLKRKVSLGDVARRLGIVGFPDGVGVMKSPIRAGDENPSFSVWQGEGGLRWTDHGVKESGDQITLIEKIRGCSTREAIGMLREMAGDLPPSRTGKDGKAAARLVKVYDYLTAEGKLHHQTLRYEPKMFRQRRPACEGERAGNKQASRDREGSFWLWTLAGITPVLYRLPELLAKPEEMVLIFEGEKDADLAAESDAKIVATTAPMGAGKWRDEYTATLAGRRVLVVPDRDKAGQDHALAVGQALRDKGRCQVRLVRWEVLWPTAPAEGKVDFADWISVWRRSQ
jgi:DNA primase